MANVILKKDFTDGEKLFGQQLNNNFGAIEAALATMNKIVWQDDPDDSVITFRGTTEEVNAREIIDGQLLYDTTTGETYIDYGSQRISTGSGNAIFIGDTVPTNPSTQLWINPEESLLPINTEVVNSMEGEETTKAPSVASAKSYIDTATDFKGNLLWTNSDPTVNFNDQTIELSSSDYDVLEILYIDYRANQRVQSTKMKKGNSANLTTIFLTGNQLYMATRQMDYVDDTHYTFDNCHSVTNVAITTLNTSSSAQCIPIYVIGYKTGMFDGGGN